MNVHMNASARSRVAMVLVQCMGASLLLACNRTSLREPALAVEPPRIPLPVPLDSLDVHGVQWSHDGRLLAFGATYNKQNDVYTVRPDGSGLRRITDASSLNAGTLALLSWLPRDEGLLLLAHRDSSWQLYRIKPDGSGLSAFPRPATAIGSVEGALSPDGSRIVFVNEIDRSHHQLFARNVDGTNVRQLTHSTGRVWSDRNPAWSPDGRFITFDSIRDTTGAGEMYRINADGTGERRLTTSSPVNNAGSHWSPDGRHLLWGQVANRRGFLVESDPDGGNFRKIADDLLSGTYSPDGKRIAASGRADDPRHWFVVVIRADGTDKRRLVLRPGSE